MSSEDSVDDNATTSFCKIVNYIYSEKSRLKAELLKGQNEGIKYRNNAEFGRLLNHLLKLPMGNIELFESHHRTHTKQKRSRKVEIFNSNDAQSSTVNEQPTIFDGINRTEVSPRPNAIELVFGDVINGSNAANARPCSVVAVPNLDCYAVLYTNWDIDLISPCHQVQDSFQSTLDSSTQSKSSIVIAYDSDGRQFITVQNGNIGVIPLVLGCINSSIYELKISHLIYEPFGLAVDAKHRRLFTACGSQLEVFSLSTWSRLSFYRVRSHEVVRKLQVLAMLCDKLYFRGNNGVTLYFASISSSGGEIFGHDYEEVASGYNLIKDLDCDASGNLLVLDVKYLDILTPEGSRIVRHNLDNFHPSSLAVMNSSTGDETTIVITDVYKNLLVILSYL